MIVLNKLIKINLLTFFDFYKILNIKNKKDLKKVIPMILLYIYAFGFFSYSVYYAASFTLKGLKELGLEHILLVAVMAFSSIYLVITTMFQVNKTLFNAKDYPILLSLPIKKSTIILSKLFVLYFMNLIFLSLIILPTYISYIVHITPNISFHIMFWLSFLFIPVVPTIIGSIIGSLLTGVSSRFKYNNIANIVISLLFIFVLYYLTYNMQNMTSIDFANLSQSIVTKINTFYPLSKIYLNIIKDNNLISLITFISVSIIIFILFKYVIEKFFDKINNRLNSITISNKYNDTKIKISKPIIALYKKELKRYFSSPVYVLNTAIGPILLIVSLVMLNFYGADGLDELLQMPSLSQFFVTSGSLVFGVFISLSCTTHSSISLEGKNLWIMKSIPVQVKEIFIAKIMVNLTIILPAILIGGLLLGYTVNMTFIDLLSVLLIPIIYALLIAGIGLLINLIFPIFDWINEVKVVKQSLASFITILTGLLITILPLTISHKFNITYYQWVVGLIMLIITIVLYKILFTKGVKIFKQL